jgi:hypothetical protein
MEMKILKTMMFFSDCDEGTIYKVDTIEYQGKRWLVPEWLDNAREGWRSPARIICIDLLKHQNSPGGPADFVLNDGIPKAVFDGQIPPQSEGFYVVIERPDIKFPAIGG